MITVEANSEQSGNENSERTRDATDFLSINMYIFGSCSRIKTEIHSNTITSPLTGVDDFRPQRRLDRTNRAF